MPRDDIDALLDDLLLRRAGVTAREFARLAGISRQAAHRRLKQEVDAGRLAVEGSARATRYLPRTPTFVFALAGLEEDRVWDDVAAKVPALAGLVGVDRSAVAYAFAEMVNNAIDHSGGSDVRVCIRTAPGRLGFEVVDDGEGAFEHFRRVMGLTDALEAIQEISKGKATTDRLHHTGEGIFFTSKVASRFEIHAGAFRWIVDNELRDHAVLAAAPRLGTAVAATFALPVKRPLTEVFAEYTEDFAFNRTRTVVRLFEVGTEFVSRSEARRLISGLERFAEVVVDFTGVAGIGQGFADEIFRVWATAHPEVRLVPEHMNAAVAFMVRRALTTGP